MSDSDAERSAQGVESGALSSPELWYRERYRFQCTRCGQYCTGSDGTVSVSQEEEWVFAGAPGLDQEALRAQSPKQLFGHQQLHERDESGDRIFLEDERYRVCAPRLVQYQGDSRWPALLESPERWRKEVGRCEGLSGEAPLVLLDKTEAQTIAPRERR